jgi:hypothetical protein
VVAAALLLVFALSPSLYSGSGRGVSADTISRPLLRFLDACGSAPCFVVANYMEAHAPLQPSRSLAGTFVESDYRVDRGPPKLNRDDADLIEYIDGPVR